MSDRYIDFANSSFGHRLVGALGLPSPVRLERWQAGRLRPVEGALLIGGGPLAERVSAFANRLTESIYRYGEQLNGFPATARNSKPWCSTPVNCCTPTSSNSCANSSSH
jgi:3-oxoacyl-[acyl-carrier protein] reductase